ncbi:hypothetical protein F511_38563 [Dorcoceras hygrometricum]|uniref:Uncharacterized protein n=1 Tax=Dorcoceras hygrometricum TaxID=472368 RepID=A0A2Z7CZG0_9LAMI|nr:hypothetical protein F511_38563 [Dorcoceras hygrometricum]
MVRIVFEFYCIDRLPSNFVSAAPRGAGSGSYTVVSQQINDKKPSRKHDRKVLMAEESTKSWADSDSESSSSSSSSSDSEQEEVHCLMADQTYDDEVFDFSNVDFTREDLVNALNDMVKEYRKLSHSFEEVKAENADLKNSSVESSVVELGDTNSFKIELSKLTAENDVLKNDTSELKAKIEILKQVVSAWNRSSRSLHKLNESQKLANDKSGLGFNSSEFSEGKTSTQKQHAYDKFNKMNFVKANAIYDCFESVKYDDQNSPKLSEKGKAGIGFSKPESSKPNWLKNKLYKDKAKAGQKPFVPNQPWRSSINVLSTRRGFREVRLPESQQGSNRGFPLLRGKTVILHWGSEKWFFRSYYSVSETESIGPI